MACLAAVLLITGVVSPQMLLRPCRPPTALRQVTVVAPSTDAAPLLAALRARGAEADAAAPDSVLSEGGITWRADRLPRTMVLVGGIHNNAAMLPLYGNYLSFADATYPGGDGFVVRTVAAPFGPGTQAVLVEATSPAGAKAGVARLLELLAQATERHLPAALEAHLSPDLARVAAQLPPAARYALTGAPDAARQGLAALLAAANERGWFDAGDYGVERYVREALYLQDAPGLTADEQRRLDEALFTTCRLATDQYWRARDGHAIGGRHQTMGTSAFAAAVQLLRRRGEPNAAARALLEQWWSQSAAYWRNACATFHDDLEGFPIYCSPEPTIDQAFAFGHAGYLREQLPLAALRAVAATDNLGCYCGTGTYEECRPGDVYKPMPLGWVLSVADYFQPGRGWRQLGGQFPYAYGWNWALGRRLATVRTFDGGRAGQLPADLLGLLPVPLGPYRHQRLPASERPPLERCYEKLAGRESYARDAQYFVLQGYQPTSADNVLPLDNNSLIRFTDLGHVWLHANSEKQGNLHRNAVYCSDGVSAVTPARAGELLGLHNGPKVALASSRLSALGPSTWTRHLVWRRGHYLVLIDVVRSERAGRFALTCTFRTPQPADLTADGLLAREGDAAFRVVNADPVRLSLEGGHELEGAAVPSLLRESRVLSGPAGTVATFRNLLFATDSAHAADLAVRPVGAHALLVQGRTRGVAELALIAAAAEGPIRVGPFASDAQLVYIGTGGVQMAGGQRVALHDRPLGAASDDAVTTALRQLWQSAAPVPRPAVAMPALRPPGRPAAPVFTPLPAPVAAPVLPATPSGEGLAGTLFDRVITRGPTVRWPAGEVCLELDLREVHTVSQIDFQVGLLGEYNRIADAARLPAPRTVAAEFSRDRFTADRRQRELRFVSDCTYENLHKGSVWPILRWTCGAIGEPARWLRLTFAAAQWPGGLALNELSVRPTGAGSARVLGAIQRDLDGDGRPELLLWSDQAELVALRQDDTVLWRRTFGGAITTADVFAELAKSPRVVVTTREARLYCLDGTGQELWRTDFLASAEQNGDLPIGYSVGLLKSPAGQPLLVVGNYNLASYVSAEGMVLHYQRLPAAFQTLTLRRGLDLDGSGVEALLSGEVWGTLSVLDSERKLRQVLRKPTGRGVALCTWGEPRAGDATALVCSENGVGRLDLRTMTYRWQHAIAPINGAALGDLDGSGRLSLAVAKHDGFVLVFDDAGQLQRQVLLGEPGRAVAVVPGRQTATVVAALPDRLVRLAGDEAVVLVTGEYERLLTTGAPGELVAVTPSGGVVRLRL